jgi:hypothetical protein
LFIHIPSFVSSYAIPISFAFLVFTYAHASYRIAGGDDRSESRRAGRRALAGHARIGGAHGRGARRGASGVSGPPA